MKVMLFEQAEMAGRDNEVLTGRQQVYQSNGDPNGVVTAQAPAICFDEVNKTVWWKTDGKYSNTGWH